jgi:hypothetical protein
MPPDVTTGYHGVWERQRSHGEVEDRGQRVPGSLF